MECQPKIGTPGKIQTCDPLLRRQMLCSTELRERYLFKNGGTGGTPTPTLFLAADFKSAMAGDYITVPVILR